MYHHLSALTVYKELSAMTIYLYVKTHNVTGLKYLGQTSSNDPYKYQGSGKYWRLHLKKHGNNVTTEILKECESKADIKEESENLGNTIRSYDREGLTVTYSPLIGTLNPSKHEEATVCTSEMSAD